MQLDQIIAIGGRPGLFEIALQTRTGVVATSLVDGKRINASVRNQVSLLSEINIYGLDKEVPLRDILKRILKKEEGKPARLNPKLQPMSWKLFSLKFFKITTRIASILPISRKSFSGTTSWRKKPLRFLPKKCPRLQPKRMNSRKDQLAAIDRLLTIMDELREQCPWDRKQTFESLRHLTIEETYELGDAILERNLEEIKNELGDLLLHIAFYAKLGAKKKPSIWPILPTALAKNSSNATRTSMAM